MMLRVPDAALCACVLLFCCACETTRSAPPTTPASSRCAGQPKAVTTKALLDSPASFRGQLFNVSGVALTTTGKRKTIAGMRRWAKGEEPKETDCLTRQWLVASMEGGDTSLDRRVELIDASGVVFCPSRSCDAKVAAATCAFKPEQPTTIKGVFSYDEGLMLASLERCDD